MPNVRLHSDFGGTDDDDDDDDDDDGQDHPIRPFWSKSCLQPDRPTQAGTSANYIY